MPEITELSRPRYRRVLLKLSGEALMGEATHGIDPTVLSRLAEDIAHLQRAGIAVAVVLGGGNLFRGERLAAAGMNRVTGDHLGMLATLMNALAMGDAIERRGGRVHVRCAFPVGTLCRAFDHREAMTCLQAGEAMIFAGGTGNPFFTTDSAASLRAAEIGAELLIKATKVDGVYSADPVKDPTAVRYPRLSYDQVLHRGLGVMDATAIVLCRDHRIPVRVACIHEPGVLIKLVNGEDIGSLITDED